MIPSQGAEWHGLVGVRRFRRKGHFFRRWMIFTMLRGRLAGRLKSENCSNM
jgi:hypothetical protein